MTQIKEYDDTIIYTIDIQKWYDEIPKCKEWVDSQMINLNLVDSELNQIDIKEQLIDDWWEDVDEDEDEENQWICVGKIADEMKDNFGKDFFEEFLLIEFTPYEFYFRRG